MRVQDVKVARSSYGVHRFHAKEVKAADMRRPEVSLADRRNSTLHGAGHQAYRPRPFSRFAKATQQPRGFIIILTLFLNTTHTVLWFQLVFLLFTTWYTAYKTFNFV